MKSLPNLFAALAIFCASSVAFGGSTIVHNPEQKLVTMSDAQGWLTLRLNYSAGCRLDQVTVRGRDVAAAGGSSTGIRIGDDWFSARTASNVKVKGGRKSVRISGIKFGPPGQELEETWKFTPQQDHIIWQITRKSSASVTLTDMAFPEWNFSNMSAWTGGLLDHGGVVWNKYLDRANATYGGQFGAVTFWNVQSNDCLRITPNLPKGYSGAGRFSRQPDDTFSFHYAITSQQLKPKHGQNRFLGDRQDLWQPFLIAPSEVTAEFVLQALDYEQTYDRGTLVGLDENNIRELLNTVARYGVIDARLVGGNGWRSGYICLHEPFFAQIAAAVNSPDYTANLAAFLDNARDHAINQEGRVKSRWTYGPWDAMPGSYDEFGFYEAQWGYLLDSQPDYVMNVVELYHLTGDRKWLAGHKQSCERALEFLLRREVGHSGLVAMMTDSHQQNRGSDWIDIIWAAYENAFVNARLYAALNLWAEAEIALGDARKAGDYRAFATRLKHSFNKPTAEGGFWDATNQWYVYWRDKGGSIHGNNLVTPVNFAAIAYGLCDDPARRKAILDRIENEMQKENLFYWPLSFFPFAPEEGAASNFPFPKYENGDLFLSWGELGVRAYASYNPALALQYVKNILDRYAKDGLSFQRYLRQSQAGAGDDILAGNCMPVVGLYRNIYGIQPKPTRLYLEPHLPRELSRTKLNYEWRGQKYEIGLSPETYRVTAGAITFQSPHPFGVNAQDNKLQYFPGATAEWSFAIQVSSGLNPVIEIARWPLTPTATREWTVITSRRSGKITQTLRGLTPKATYQLHIAGKPVRVLQTDAQGQIQFEWKPTSVERHQFKVQPME